MIIYESERKILDALWEEGDMKASGIVKIMKDKTGWARNTTYTVLKKCEEKQLITRTEPGYICSAAVSRKKVQREELEDVLDKYFGGSVTNLFSSLLNIKQITKYDAKKMKKLMKEKAE